VALIELKNVSFAYGTQPVLRGISLSVREGEMLGIIGPNSSGKSTLLRLLAGVLRPSSGSVTVGGESICNLRRREAAKIVSFVPQETPVSFPFTVFEIVLMGRTPYLSPLSFEKEEDYRIAHEALKETDTYDLRERYLDELSGGERQLVIMARALAQETPVMLLDEPIAFLDIRHQVDIFEIIARLNRERSRTVVIVSHDLNLAALYCNRLVLLGGGGVAADGAPEEVFSSPVLQEVYGVRMTVSAGPGGRPFVFTERKVELKGE
jgi:iron complex transport system ATP-binding protein